MATISQALALAIQHHQAGQLQVAEQLYRQILAADPNHADAWHLLGVLACQAGKPEVAVEYIGRAVELKPDSAEAHNSLGDTLQHKGELGEAIACYRLALELKPDYPEAHNNLGNAFMGQGKVEEAIACFRQALERKPDYAEAHSNLGIALQAQGSLEEAIACYRRAVEFEPEHATALSELIHQLQHACLWQDLEQLSRRAIRIVETGKRRAGSIPFSPFAFLTLPVPTSAGQQYRCTGQWVDHSLKSAVQQGKRLALARPHGPRSRITLSYLSADFRDHATARLIVELFEKHDRARFAVHGYSFGTDDGSALRRRLVRAFDRFTDLQTTPLLEAAERIAADGVDILVDLKGYTRDSRPALLALRPAPVQVNYLGYPGTMAAPFMDYILVDDFIVPAAQQPYYSERLVHLPGCYQVNDSRRPIAATAPARADCGLPAEGFVFCSFNSTYKITPLVFEAWMTLLREAPGSVLWLLDDNRMAPGNLRREAETRGVSAQRLVFAPKLSSPQHLARYRLVDLFLDTFPVNAHTTASDALWAGCPVVTLVGETFVSRVAGSLLRALDLSELVTTSLADYQALALRLARDREALAKLRARLEVNRKTAPLFDAGQFAHNLEKAYGIIWERHLSGEKPAAFAVNL